VLPSALSTCSIYYKSVAYSGTCAVTSATITVTGTTLAKAVVAGDVIYLAVGPITNPQTQLNNKTISLSVYTDSSLATVADIYTYAVKFLCRFPCKSCLTNQPLACTAC